MSSPMKSTAVTMSNPLVLSLPYPAFTCLKLVDFATSPTKKSRTTTSPKAEPKMKWVSEVVAFDASGSKILIQLTDLFACAHAKYLEGFRALREIPVGQRLLVRLNTNWAFQLLSDYNRSQGFLQKIQLSTEAKQHVLDVQLGIKWRDAHADPEREVELDLSYYFEFLGTQDPDYIDGHETWGGSGGVEVAVNNDADEAEDEKAVYAAAAFASSAKRNAVAAFY